MRTDHISLRRLDFMSAFAPGFAHQLRGALHRLPPAPCDEDPGAGFAQGDGDALADATARPGDTGRAPAQQGLRRLRRTT